MKTFENVNYWQMSRDDFWNSCIHIRAGGYICENTWTQNYCIIETHKAWSHFNKSTILCARAHTHTHTHTHTNKHKCTNSYTNKSTWFAFHLSGLSGQTSQFLNGTHEFLELVLARMSLLIDLSRSVLPLRSAKAREFGELWREKCTRTPWTFQFKLARSISFRPAGSVKWKTTLDYK